MVLQPAGFDAEPRCFRIRGEVPPIGDSRRGVANAPGVHLVGHQAERGVHRASDLQRWRRDDYAHRDAHDRCLPGICICIRLFIDPPCGMPCATGARRPMSTGHPAPGLRGRAATTATLALRVGQPSGGSWTASQQEPATGPAPLPNVPVRRDRPSRDPQETSSKLAAADSHPCQLPSGSPRAIQLS